MQLEAGSRRTTLSDAHDYQNQLFSTEDDKVIVESLNKIVVSGSKKLTYDEMAEPGCFGAYNLKLSPEEIGALETRLKPMFYHKPLTQRLISRLKTEVILFYSSIDRPVVLVDVPEQEVTHGVLLLRVIEGTVGDVKVVGNKFFSAERYLSNFKQKKGSVLRSDKLAADLAWLNRNPFRVVDAVYSAGNKEGETNIDLIAQDEKPWRIYGGIDNTGFHNINYLRYFAGIMGGNLFYNDQQINYQFTMSPQPHKFKAHSLSWSIPLPWRHVLTFFGGYSSIHARLQPSMASHGYGAQASFRYEIPFLPRRTLIDNFMFGIDFKRTNNSVDFGGSTVLNKGVDVFQYAMHYDFTRQKANLRTYVTLDVVFQPGGIWPDMTNQRYSALREYSRNVYVYGKFRAHNLWRRPRPYDWGIENLTIMQFTNKNLIPTEQFGLGGYDSVRGYSERDINVDNAVVISTNFYSPGVTFYKKAGTEDRLVGLVFVDYGMGWQHHRTSADFRNLYILAGVGPGFRYHIGHWFTARFDWGYKLRSIQGDPPRTRATFSATAAY